MKSDDLFLALNQVDERHLAAADAALGGAWAEVFHIRKVKKVVRTVLVAAVLITALTATVFAADLLGIRAMQIEGRTLLIDGAERSLISMSTPQEVPVEISDPIKLAVENKKAAMQEWWNYKEQWTAEHEPEIVRFLDEITPRIYDYTINDDDSTTIYYTDPDGTKQVYVSPIEDQEALGSWSQFLATSVGGYTAYQPNNQEQLGKLLEISEKYHVFLLNESTGHHLLWQESSMGGKTGEGFLPIDKLMEKTTEIGNRGNIFARTPEKFDKLYWLDEGTFGSNFFVQIPETGRELSVYIYNSPYTTLSEFSMPGPAESTACTERSYHAPDGTDVTVLSDGTQGMCYVYLEYSYFTVKISDLNGGSLNDAEIDECLSYLNYSLIGN